MNKKNFPVFISVFITSLFFTMVIFFAYTNVQMNYKEIRQKNFADASLDIKLHSDEIKKIEKIESVISAGGLSKEKSSALYKDSMLALNFQDTTINKMMEYSDLIEGRFAENQSEIVVSKSIIDKYKLKIGDSISLSIGDRYLDKQKINPSTNYTKKETFIYSNDKVYEIVGIYDVVYNKYLNINFALTVPDNNMTLSPYLRFEDFKTAYKNREKIKNELENLLSTKLDLEFSETLIHYYRAKSTGLDAFSPILIEGIAILFTILLFVFFIRNIFKVWGLRKVQKLSIYKSIGSANFQIYQILMKEAIFISILPILLGHIIGYYTMNFIYKKMQEIRMVDRILGLEFSVYLSFIILFIAFFIIILAVISPVREISKMSIIDGIKGNFYSKNRKKKSSNNLWKELRLNNMASIKSLRYITAVGSIIISCFLIVIGISFYYRDFSAYKDSEYNINVVYKTSRQETPEVFREIMNTLPYEKAYISRLKYFNVAPDFKFSKEIKENRLDEHLKERFKGLDTKRIDGLIIGLEEKELKKFGGEKGEFLLLNIVQKDPRTPLSKAEYVKYLDNPKYLNLYLSGEKPVNQVKIDRLITSTYDVEERLNPYDVHLFTDLETQRNLIINHEKASEAKANFLLKIKVKDSNLLEAKDYIEKILKSSVSVNDQFRIITGDEISRNQDTSMKVFIMMIIGIGAVIILLNLTNGYAGINMSLLSRKREMGSLLSCGMEKSKIQFLYINEFLIECLKSLFITCITTVIIMFIISLFSCTLTISLLLEYYHWGFFVLFSILIYFADILIYYFSIRTVLKTPAIELIKKY